jgi:hypothetical protein
MTSSETMISNDDMTRYINATLMPKLLSAGIGFHAIEYVSDVIKRNLRTSTFFVGGNDVPLLVDLYSSAITSKEKNVKLVKFKQLGETALVISGMFRKYAIKRMGNMYYIDMGSTAYASAASLSIISSNVYDDVSRSFSNVSDIINDTIESAT